MTTTTAINEPPNFDFAAFKDVVLCCVKEAEKLGYKLTQGVYIESIVVNPEYDEDHNKDLPSLEYAGCCAIGALSICHSPVTKEGLESLVEDDIHRRRGKTSFALSIAHLTEKFPQADPGFLAWLAESLEAGFENWGSVDGLGANSQFYSRMKGLFHNAAYELGQELGQLAVCNECGQPGAINEECHCYD